MNIRSQFSPAIADRIKKGKTVSQAIHDVLGGMKNGGYSVLDILADLEDLKGKRPIDRKRALRCRHPQR